MHRTANVALNLPIKVPAAEEISKPESTNEMQPLSSNSILNSLRTENEVVQKTEAVSMSVDSDVAPKIEDVDMEMTANSAVEVIESVNVIVRQNDDMVVDENDEDEGEAYVVRSQL